jgi:hypothetical protein
MKRHLTLALVAALMGGCAIVPAGYDNGYDRGYHRDGNYRSDRYSGDDYYRQDHRWQGDAWRDNRRDSFGIYYRNWDHGQ